ncbi:MAG: hypothetical protein HZA88_15550 [Verrucomicrobia bacterium]|nr:hypothetical protein [Verrucomicrobiota bacterium]
MSLMKSIDGRLYNVPDEQAAKYLIPADKVAETLKEAGLQVPTGTGPASQEAGQIQAYHHGGHHGHHGGHHGGHWGGGWGGGWGGFVVAPYSNYSNYSNYRNFGW